MQTPTEHSIILSVMEIESGRRLLGYDISPKDTNGGYTDDPDDPGGRTNWGFTEKTLRRAWLCGRCSLTDL